MNKYKIVFEKTFTNRCVSKNIEHAVFLDSEFGLNQKDEISKLGYSRLVQENPKFILDNSDINSSTWSKPIIKNIIRVNETDE